MDDCSKHPKDVAGISDMKDLANRIGDLHYGKLAELFAELPLKFFRDAINDGQLGNKKLSKKLNNISNSLGDVSTEFDELWQISKPFMESKVK
jgi:hypothetical protein